MAISLLHRNTDMARLGCRIMVVLLLFFMALDFSIANSWYCIFCS